MRPPLFLAMFLAAPLAGCGSDTPPPLTGNLTDTVTDSRGAHAGSFRGPDNGSADDGNAAARIEPAAGAPAAPATAASPAGSLPAAFQGRWASVAKECDPANAAIAKGLMVIAGDKLSFYESRGLAGAVRQSGPRSVAFDLPISGEGMTWTEATRLTLQGDGRTLVRAVTAPSDRVGTSTYQRCPS